MAEPEPINTTTIVLVPIDFGSMVGVVCPECDVINRRIDVGTTVIGVGVEDIDIYGIINFDGCGCTWMCPHLAERCGMILHNHEYGTLTIDDFEGLIDADHADAEDEDGP